MAIQNCMDSVARNSRQSSDDAPAPAAHRGQAVQSLRSVRPDPQVRLQPHTYCSASDACSAGWDALLAEVVKRLPTPKAFPRQPTFGRGNNGASSDNGNLKFRENKDLLSQCDTQPSQLNYNVKISKF
jgi:hypothetical protein